MDCPRILLEEQGYAENYDIEKGYNYREYVDPLYLELSDSEYVSDNEFDIGNPDDEVIIRILDVNEKSDKFSQIQEQECEVRGLLEKNYFLNLKSTSKVDNSNDNNIQNID